MFLAATTATYGRLFRCKLRQSLSLLVQPNRANHWLPNMASGKLEAASFKSLLTPDLLFLESIFRENGYAFRLVGGVVRDLLLDKIPKDIDIATECKPDEMIKLFKKYKVYYIPTGLQHGTITAHINSRDYEVTTLRIDRLTDGRHAEVEFTEDWREDAERRDLTINAMSLDLQGNLYDYFNGQQHLAERKVVFVGDAHTRICEDFLRILRYFRFYGRISPSPDLHDPDTLQAIRDTAEGLTGISVERVWQEMSKILQGNHAPHLLKTMYNLQVSKYIGLPEDGDFAEFEKVWTAMRLRETMLEPVSLLMALISSSEEAYLIIHRWKMSKQERRFGLFVVNHRTLAYREDFQLKTCQDYLVDGVSNEIVLELLNYCNRPDLAAQLVKWSVPKLPVSGKDLMAAGIKPGPQIGKMLRQLHEKWKESYFTLCKDDLLESALRECNKH